jgi:hypothetical protein
MDDYGHDLVAWIEITARFAAARMDHQTDFFVS